MHRIDTPTAQKDKFGQGKNGFTNGDPTTGTPSTHLNSDIFDALQEEPCTVIEKSDIKLDKNRHDQLYHAIKKLASDAVDKAKAELIESLRQKLTKIENGADIPDKNQFIKNLGLTETVDCAKNALDKRTGGTVKGEIISQGGQISLKGDNRKHLGFHNQDGSVRMWLYKDKGGDGVRLHNGNDGGGEYVFHKDGGFRAPSSVYAGVARMAADGNIYGSQWGNQWLDAYLRKTFQPKGDYSKPNTAKSEVSGWWKCGDTGYTTQYGHVLDVSPGEVRIVDFNIPFKQAVRCIVVTPDRFGFQNGLVGGYAAVINNKSFNLTNDYANTGHNSNFWWMAVGM